MNVASLVRRAVTSPHYELEARVGRWDGSGGVSVTAHELDALDAMLRASGHLESSHWNEGHCYFFNHNGRALRTQIEFSSRDLAMQTATVCKVREAVLDAPAADLQCRFSLSRETPVSEVPDVVLPDRVRIRQRASHTYVGKVCTVRYDLSRTWMGDSKTEAEDEQQKAPPRCEVELEVVKAHAADADAVARSLLAKVNDVASQIASL